MFVCLKIAWLVWVRGQRNGLLDDGRIICSLGACLRMFLFFWQKNYTPNGPNLRAGDVGRTGEGASVQAISILSVSPTEARDSKVRSVRGFPKWVGLALRPNFANTFCFCPFSLLLLNLFVSPYIPPGLRHSLTHSILIGGTVYWGAFMHIVYPTCVHSRKPLPRLAIHAKGDICCPANAIGTIQCG